MKKTKTIKTKDIQICIIAISCLVTFVLSIALHINKAGFYLIPVLVGLVTYFVPIVYKDLKEMIGTGDNVLLSDIVQLEEVMGQEIVEPLDSEVVDE